MASISAVMNTDGLGHLIPGVGAKVKTDLSLAVRDSLVAIERRHKRKEIGKALPRGTRARSSTWSSRTGNHSKSFHRDWKKGQLHGAYGSDRRRAEKLEDGGEIRPKGKYLTIPTMNVPAGGRAGDFSDLFFIMSKKGNPLLVKSTGKGSFSVMFILVKSVKLKPRPALKRAIKATEKQRDKIMLDAFEHGIGGKTSA